MGDLRELEKALATPKQPRKRLEKLVLFLLISFFCFVVFNLQKPSTEESKKNNPDIKAISLEEALQKDWISDEEIWSMTPGDLGLLAQSRKELKSRIAKILFNRKFIADALEYKQAFEDAGWLPAYIFEYVPLLKPERPEWVFGFPNNMPKNIIRIEIRYKPHNGTNWWFRFLDNDSKEPPGWRESFKKFFGEQVKDVNTEW